MLSPSSFNIISVSRLSEEKAHLRTLRVLERLKNEGLTFTWHILGDGPMREEIETAVKQKNMADVVKLYGNQINPYKYIVKSDLLLLASLNESFGLVLINAFMLGVPVLSTNTISAQEVVGEKGFVCENGEEALYNTLKYVIMNKGEVEKKKELLRDYTYENIKIKTKFKELLGS